MLAQLSLKRPGWLVRPSGKHLPPSTLFWLLQSGGWWAFGMMMFGRALGFERWLPALIDVGVLVLLGCGLTLLFRGVYRYGRRQRAPPTGLAASAAALAVVGAPTWYALHAAAMRLTGLDHAAAYSSMRSAVPVETWFYYGFVLLTWSLLYFGVNGWISLELERGRAARADAMAQSARLQALQSQLEPHFFFNTLNCISTLVVEGNNTAAAAMIARLSEFLRLSLRTLGTPEITVAQELQFVRQYLELQQLRFGGRLQYRINVEPEALPAMVPTLLLQPLVENAVRHGILARESGGSITVSIDAHADALRVLVEDDGPGLRKSPGGSTGMGLSNTATRLSALYGNHAKFSVGRADGGGVAVGIGIPLHFAAAADA